MRLAATQVAPSSSSIACRPLAGRRCGRRQGACRQAPVAGLFDDLFNYEKWAPRSSQVWRLGQNPADLRREAQQQQQEEALGEAAEQVLNRRLAEARQQADGAAAPVGAAASAAAAAAAAVGEAEGPPSDEELQERPSFLRSTDEEVAAALNDRIARVAATRSAAGGAVGGGGEEGEEGEEGALLTGPLLRELLLAKWGKQYDVSFVRRDLPLGKTLICLNVMWTHLEQRSFPMTEEEYDEKLDLVALYLNSWGQAERVAAYLRQPARPRKGMPSKPIVGTAISIQLDLDQPTIDEFFSQGGV